MALGLVGRKSFIPFLVCAAASLAQGCFTTKCDDDSSSKGCTKDTDCAAGRICNNGTCMNEGDSSGGSSGSGSILSGGTGGTGTGTGGSGNANGTGGSKGGTGGSSTGGSANATGGTSGTSTGGTAGASGGSAGACAETDPATCPSADSMTFCLNGAETTLTCDYFCTTLGFTSGPCEDGYGCQCGDPTDDACANGVNAYCSCISGTSTPCDPNDPNNDPVTFYVDCHANAPSEQEFNDFLKCFGTQLPSGSMLSTSICQNAAVACGATPPDGTAGAGGTGGSAGAPPTP
jgi:hypothetical protein